MATTTKQAHPEVLEELHRAYRMIARLQERLDTVEHRLALAAGFTFEDGYMHQREMEHTATYVVRTHHPKGSEGDAILALSHDADGAATSDAPHGHQHQRLMFTEGEVYHEVGYLHAEHAAAARAHFEAKGHTTSHHHIRATK